MPDVCSCTNPTDTFTLLGTGHLCTTAVTDRVTVVREAVAAATAPETGAVEVVTAADAPVVVVVACATVDAVVAWEAAVAAERSSVTP